METATQVLIIILSTTLTVFLIVAIVLGVYLVKVAKSVKHVTSEAEKAVDNMVNVSHMVRKTIKPAAFSAGIAEFFKNMANKKDKKD